MSASAAKRSPTMITIIHGDNVAGFLLARGRQGIEAFDRDERSLGVFTDPQAAHDAVIAADANH